MSYITNLDAHQFFLDNIETCMLTFNNLVGPDVKLNGSDRDWFVLEKYTIPIGSGDESVIGNILLDQTVTKVMELSYSTWKNGGYEYFAGDVVEYPAASETYYRCISHHYSNDVTDLSDSSLWWSSINPSDELISTFMSRSEGNIIDAMSINTLSVLPERIKNFNSYLPQGLSAMIDKDVTADNIYLYRIYYYYNPGITDIEDKLIRATFYVAWRMGGFNSDSYYKSRIIMDILNDESIYDEEYPNHPEVRILEHHDMNLILYGDEYIRNYYQ